VVSGSRVVLLVSAGRRERQQQREARAGTAASCALLIGSRKSVDDIFLPPEQCPE